MAEIDHYKEAESALARAEDAYQAVQGEEVEDLVLLRDVHYNLQFSQAHMALAQVDRYGQAAGAVKGMADAMTAEATESEENEDG